MKISKCLIASTGVAQSIYFILHGYTNHAGWGKCFGSYAAGHSTFYHYIAILKKNLKKNFCV